MEAVTAVTCSTITTRKDQLREISPEVCEHPILAVKCSLDSASNTRGHNDEDHAKLKKLVDYEETYVTVLGDLFEGKTIIQL